MKGTPLSPEQAQARIDVYRGSKSTSKPVKEFVKQVVRDALHVAPQPPTTAWISAGYQNSYGHPHVDVAARLHKAARRVVRIDQLGGTIVVSDGLTLSTRTWAD